MAEASYMREYRKKYRQTPEGRAKILAGRKRWKNSENGKAAARRHAKKKYVPSDRALLTAEEKRHRRLVRQKNYNQKIKPDRKRRWRDDMQHLRRYGITKETYLEMLVAQSGGCAICGGTNGSSRNRRVLCVDHCHDTGKVRGLLCDNCNKGIGCLQDDAANVRRALLYLEAHHG